MYFKERGKQRKFNDKEKANDKKERIKLRKRKE